MLADPLTLLSPSELGVGARAGPLMQFTRVAGSTVQKMVAGLLRSIAACAIPRTWV